MAYTDKKMELPEGFIDLGEKLSTTDLRPMEMKEVSYHYPSLYFGDAKGMESLPDSGTATIYFKKTMERKEIVSTENGTEKRFSVELQICGIKPDDEVEILEKEDPEDIFEREISKYESEEDEYDGDEEEED